MPPRTPAAVEKKIHDMATDGSSIPEIGTSLGMDQKTVLRILRRIGAPVNKYYDKIKPSVERLILSTYKKEGTISKTAEATGISMSAVHRVLCKFGAEMSPVGVKPRVVTAGMLWCSTCNKEVAIAAFNMDSSRKRGHQTQCRSCYNDSRTLRRFGITLAEAHLKWESNDRKCEGCGKQLAWEKAVIDHVHGVGPNYRGILCISCNSGIGHVEATSLQGGPLFLIQRMSEYCGDSKWREIGKIKVPGGRADRHERYRDGVLSRYGITPQDFEKRLSEQDNSCSCCKTKYEAGKRSFHVDHNHVTGTLRGILCIRCNLTLGAAGVDTDAGKTLELWAKYIETNLPVFSTQRITTSTNVAPPRSKRTRNEESTSCSP